LAETSASRDSHCAGVPGGAGRDHPTLARRAAMSNDAGVEGSPRQRRCLGPAAVGQLTRSATLSMRNDVACPLSVSLLANLMVIFCPMKGLRLNATLAYLAAAFLLE